jgi:hypothetical protein
MPQESSHAAPNKSAPTPEGTPAAMPALKFRLRHSGRLAPAGEYGLAIFLGKRFQTLGNLQRVSVGPVYAEN